MRIYHVPVGNIERLKGKIVWMPHLILRNARGRYIVNIFLLRKIEYSPRKALLIRTCPENLLEGRPTSQGTIIELENVDPESIIDDLNYAYLDSSELAKSKAYQRAKFLGRHNLKRIIFIPTGFIRALYKDDSLAEEFREASYGAMIMRETIFWRGERPIAEGLVYMPTLLLKEETELKALKPDMSYDRVLTELIKREKEVYESLKTLLEES